jgi:hypothetical protein
LQTDRIKPLLTNIAVTVANNNVTPSAQVVAS